MLLILFHREPNYGYKTLMGYNIPFPIRSNNSLDFFNFSRIRSISTIARTCLSTIAAFIISRQFLSTVVKRLDYKQYTSRLNINEFTTLLQFIKLASIMRGKYLSLTFLLRAFVPWCLVIRKLVRDKAIYLVPLTIHPLPLEEVTVVPCLKFKRYCYGIQILGMTC